MTIYTDKPDELRACPYCGNPECSAEFVDIGVGGYAQCSPYHCRVCGASEIGPYDKERALSEREKHTGWYLPGNPSDFISSINGVSLDFDTAHLMYKKRMVNRIPFRLNFSKEEESLFMQGLLSGYSIHLV